MDPLIFEPCFNEATYFLIPGVFGKIEANFALLQCTCLRFFTTSGGNTIKSPPGKVSVFLVESYQNSFDLSISDARPTNFSPAVFFVSPCFEFRFDCERQAGV